jgi:plasmid maintenance system killer protein
MKPVVVRLIGEAEEEYKRLEKAVAEEKAKGIKNSEHQQLMKSIQDKARLIKANPQYGAHVPKSLIKKTGFDVDNLWSVDLTGYWRMLYTLQGGQLEILCFVLTITDHAKYDKIFGYRKK